MDKYLARSPGRLLLFRLFTEKILRGSKNLYRIIRVFVCYCLYKIKQLNRGLKPS